jgi:hypothetical protein
MLLGPCDCRCGCKVCLDLTSICSLHTPVSAVDVTFYKAGTSTVVGTGTSDASGHVCSPDLPSGLYDAKVVKTGYETETVKDLACGNHGWYMKPTNYGANFTITGCNSQRLPGATVTLTGPATLVKTTDSLGQARFTPEVPGSYTYSVAKAKFDTITGTVTISSTCGGAATVNRALSPASGYRCCSVRMKTSDVPSPEPIPTTLVISSAGGTDSFPFAAATCFKANCYVYPMSDVGASVTPDRRDCPPPPVGNYVEIPPSIGVRNSPVTYTLDLTQVPPTLTEALREYSGASGAGLAYPAAGCGVSDTRIRWRQPLTCADAASAVRYATSVTLNSLSPLSLTFTFPPGGTYGPVTLASGDGVPGRPFSTTVTIGE